MSHLRETVDGLTEWTSGRSKHLGAMRLQGGLVDGVIQTTEEFDKP